MIQAHTQTFNVAGLAVTVRGLSPTELAAAQNPPPGTISAVALVEVGGERSD